MTDALEIYIISLDKLQEQERNNTLENTALSQWAKFILAPEKLEIDIISQATNLAIDEIKKIKQDNNL